MDCVAHLSVVTQNYTHSGLYAALNRGKVNTDAVRKVAADLGNADPLYSHVYSFDTTSWLRPNSFTVDSLGRAHDPQGSKKGEPTQPGWTYSVITRQSHAGGSWSLPSHVVRVGNTEDRSVFTAQQIGEVVALHRGEKPVFVGDSGYSTHHIRWELNRRAVEADLLIRLRSGRVFREKPDVGARPHVKHGNKFHLANPEREPDRSTTFTSQRYGDVTVDVYHSLHPELSSNHAGMKNIAGNPIFDITLLHVFTTELTGVKGWWLWWDGDPDADVKFLFWCYARRFDIEHLFRFAKQTLGLTSVRPGSAKMADVWCVLVMCAYTILAACRRAIGGVCMPWERPRNWLKTTPGQLRRGVVLSLAHVLCTLGSGVRKVRPKGRAVGAKTGPRERHKVHIKHPKPG